MFDAKPITTKRPEGEYSTIMLHDGCMETILFGSDETAIATRRDWGPKSTIHRKHIEEISSWLK
jgi:hypothetical protein